MTSVTDILKKHGKWLKTSVLVTEIATEDGKSKRQAYRRLKSAWKANEIKKIGYPDRTVLYGLHDWTPPAPAEKLKQTLSFQDAFLYDCFQKLEKIGDVNTRNSRKAMLLVRSLLMTFPVEWREELMPSYLKASKSLWQKWNKEVVGFRPPLTGSPEVDFMIGRISQLLHRQISGEKSNE